MPGPRIGPLGLPSADDVARAIVAACKETGADPEAVARGDLDQRAGRRHTDESTYKISRARAYAAYALIKVFGGPKQAIARMVGVKPDSASGYFQAIDRRGGMQQKWALPLAFGRVVAAVTRDLDQGGLPASSIAEAKEIKAIEPERSSLPARREKSSPPPPFKAMPFRPPAGTYEKTLAADLDDDSPVFDRGNLGGRKPSDYYSDRRAGAMSKAEMAADLERALANTARMAAREDDDGRG